MHEINDRDLGSLKFLGVDEVRRNFRDALKDPKKIVITRHGDPLKILLDYKSYYYLVTALQDIKS